MSYKFMASDDETITIMRIEVEKLKTLIGEQEKALKLAHQNIMGWMMLAITVTGIVMRYLK